MKGAKLFSAIAVTVMILGVASCDVNNLLPDNPQENEVGPFYTVAEFVVPAGTKTDHAQKYVFRHIYSEA